MKKFKRISFVLLIFVFFVSLVSCGGNEVLDDNKLTVSFIGASIDELEVEKGESINKLPDPTKNNAVFNGWYWDSNFQDKVEFPFVVESDVTIYAHFLGYDKIFTEARNNTIGSNISSYEYDYTLTCTAAVMGLSLSGNKVGNTKYNKNSEVEFYDVSTNSGALFFDGTNYKVLEENTLQSIKVDENNEVKSVENEIVGSEYKYDSSSFAKAIFEYSDKDLKSIEKTNKPDEYKLNTSFNASSALNVLGKVLNNALVKRAIETLPATNINTGMYVTFSNGLIKTYRYEININVSAITFSLVYNLSFKNIDNVQEIKPKTINGVSLTKNQISESMSEINNVINLFKNQSESEYDFTVKTSLDHGITSLSIDSTFSGTAYRENKSDIIYFNNDIEIDSDYKNDDVYKDNDIEDVHVVKKMDENGDVYLIEKKVLKDKEYLQENYVANDLDSYYMLSLINEINEVNFVQKNSKNNEIEYSLGLNSKGIIEVLKWFNVNLDLDPLGNASIDAKIFGDFKEDSLHDCSFEFVVTVVDGKLNEIYVNINGFIDTKLTGSKNFSELKEAEFDIELSINIK